MANGIDKKALFNLKSEPYLKPISDLGVGFYNLDENTAILRFQLYNDKGPMLIHENNLTAYAYFESSNGSSSDVIELEIEDSYNGVVSITLDKEFLQASTSTTVKGQVYIGVNNVDGNPKYNEVAVFREFKFEVADALINKISSFTKVEQIRMFSQLRMKIEQEVKDIEEAIANGADYVAEMKTTLNEGLQQLTDITNTSEENITTKTQNFLSEIKSSYETTKNELEQTKTNAISSVTAKSDESIQDMQNIKDIAKVEFEDTLANFKEEIANNSFVRPDTLDNYVEKVQLDYYATKIDMENFIDETELSTKLTDMNVQQFALTNNDSTTKFLNLSGIIENLKALPTSMYYVANVPNLPSNVSSTAGFLIVLKRNSDYSKFIFSPYNSNQTFVSHKFKNNTLEWDSLGPISDTGWLPFNLINGSISNSAYGGSNGFSCSYRIIDHGKRKEKIIRLNGKNIVDKQQIAQLPVNFTENTQVHPIRTPQRSTGGFITVYPDGSVSFFKTGGYEWYTDDDIYGEISWFE